MKPLAAAVVACVVALGVAARAQTTPAPRGEIRGTLSSARGPLAGVTVRIKNAATGDVIEAATGSEGEYRAAVRAGTYEVFASPTGYGTLARRGVVVVSGATAHVDAELADNPNAGTPGEINFLYERDQHRPPSGPAPRTPDGRPDLTGVWFPGADVEPEPTPFQPWAEALTRERAAHVGDDPRAQCLPSGVMRTNALDLAKFVQVPGLLVMLMEGSVPGARQVFLDGRPHPKDLAPTWLGHSVGTWAGDTLVVDTVGFNDKGWLDAGGRPQTEKLHIIERFQRPDLGHLDVEITIDDPGAYTRPWTLRRRLDLAPNEELQEYICNENNKIPPPASR
jgi:hypothetical protein